MRWATSATVDRPPPAALGATPPARRRRSLDGLRCLAVAAVVIYHVDDRWLPGGFVGVDVFFALSGYLITALLLVERDRSGAVSLRSFWRRRVRRLWPLAWVVLAAVALAGLTGVWGADREQSLPGETAAALANVANWWQMAHGGYVESFVAPSPLRHFWSLAVEEQFYLLWPVLVVALVAVGRRAARRTGTVERGAVRALAIGTGVLFVASAVSAWFATPEVAYLATHTRAVALLAGAGLAIALRHRPLAGPASPSGRRAVAVAAVPGILVLVVAAVTITPGWAGLHRGGFSVVALASTAVGALALVPGPARRLLSLAPLVWLGRRSYAIYLIHWPLIVAMGPEAPSWLVLIVVVPTTIALAALVHVAVERPVLAGRPAGVRLAGAGLLVLALTAGSLWWGHSDAPTPSEQVAASLGRVADPTRTPGADAAPGATPAAEPSPDAAAPATTTTTAPPCVPVAAPGKEFTGGSRQFDYSTVDEVADPGAACADQVKVLVLGDSLGRGAANGLTSLTDPRIALWDRSNLGCSWAPGRNCPDWREAWPLSVLGVRPQVVVVFSRVQATPAGGDAPAFLSPEGDAQRVALFSDAARALGATGAKVLFVNAAVPGRPNGLFYCNGRRTSSPCDPAWVDAWNASLARAATETGAAVVDARTWTEARDATDRTDRPDGLHFSGDALREYSAWLLPQILLTAAAR
ncbi:MAG: acyltransferase family protein [Microthrixaceae bacterium]